MYIFLNVTQVGLFLLLSPKQFKTTSWVSKYFWKYEEVCQGKSVSEQWV